MKNLVLLVLLTVSTSGFAGQESFVGTWCQKFDDFTQVLIIEKDQSLVHYYVGNQVSEVVLPSTGFVSSGASRFLMNIEGQDLDVVDYKVKNIFGLKKLILIFSDGARQKYSQCKLKTKQ